eukprot:scaffold308_cov120-Isochrysis_galbana.AAC.1
MEVAGRASSVGGGWCGVTGLLGVCCVIGVVACGAARGACRGVGERARGACRGVGERARGACRGVGERARGACRGVGERASVVFGGTAARVVQGKQRDMHMHMRHAKSTTWTHEPTTHARAHTMPSKGHKSWREAPWMRRQCGRRVRVHNTRSIAARLMREALHASGDLAGHPLSIAVRSLPPPTPPPTHSFPTPSPYSGRLLRTRGGVRAACTNYNSLIESRV